MNQKFRYLGPYDWEEIEWLYSREATVAVIIDKISTHAATTYHECLNGYVWNAAGEPIIDAYGRRVYSAEIV